MKAVPFIHNLRTCHAVVTRDPLNMNIKMERREKGDK
jgi:hypothetical protein